MFGGGFADVLIARHHSSRVITNRVLLSWAEDGERLYLADNVHNKGYGDTSGA